MPDLTSAEIEAVGGKDAYIAELETQRRGFRARISELKQRTTEFVARNDEMLKLQQIDHTTMFNLRERIKESSEQAEVTDVLVAELKARIAELEHMCETLPQGVTGAETETPAASEVDRLRAICRDIDRRKMDAWKERNAANEARALAEALVISHEGRIATLEKQVKSEQDVSAILSGELAELEAKG